jgi:outer membrane receptor protein involved in Fe transport
LLLAFIATPLAAQGTGKIQGRVTDAASGQPIAGAQVVIAGSRLGNITNNDGFYFINNVPAGLQDIAAQYIGYQTVTVRQQRVLAGQTTTQNFQLAQAAVEIAGIEVIGETRPLVPRDQVASKAIVTGETVQDLPVDNVNQIITLQPGVIAGVGKGFSIRGGRSGEEAVFVDGVLIRNFNAGTSNLVIGVNSLSEVDVLTGGFSAEFGDAQSGIINYVTRAGGRSWSGNAMYQTDDFMPKEWSIGLHRAELSIGGPIAGGLSFFGAATAEGRKSANFGKGWRDVPIYVADGVDTVVTIPGTSGATGQTDAREVAIPNFVRYDEGGRIPYSNSDEYTLDAKLDYSYGSGSRIFITGKTSRNQGRSSFGGGLAGLYNSQGYAGSRNRAQAAILGWTHNFVQSAEQALALDVKVARTHDKGISGILDPAFDVDNRNPSFGFTKSDFEFVVDEDDFPVDETLVSLFLSNKDSIDDATGAVIRRRTPFPIEATELNSSSAFRMNPYGTIGTFETSGLGGTFGYADEKQWQVRATVDWQANRQNRVKFGGDFTDIDLKRTSIGYRSQGFAQLWVENPNRSSLFVQDRLDLGDIVVEGGLRYDRFDPKSDFPILPGFYDPTNAPENVAALQALFPDRTITSTFEAAPVRSAWSPRLGVSFPVTVNSTFRLSYGHFTQVPDLNEYFLGKNTDFFRFKNTNTNDFFARPLDMGKTIAFEFGYRQLLGPDFVLDISAYNRDKLSDVTLRKLAWSDPTNPGSVTYLNTFTNGDFGSIRGIDVRLDRRFGQIFDAMLGYSYQDAKNTGSDPFTYANIFARIESNANVLLGLPPNPAQSIRSTQENREHNITGNFSLHFPGNYETSVLRNFGLFGTFRFISGLPYTPLVCGALITAQSGLGTSCSILADRDVDTRRLPWQKTFDLKAQKGLSIAGWNTSVFLDARNVLDLKNITSVWATTGDITEESNFADVVLQRRAQLGGGEAQSNIDLTSLASAGAGVANQVDLVLLRRTEARFGNGDLKFSQDEQEAAFRSALDLTSGEQIFIGTGRRLRLGVELTF